MSAAIDEINRMVCIFDFAFNPSFIGDLVMIHLFPMNLMNGMILNSERRQSAPFFSPTLVT